MLSRLEILKAFSKYKTLYPNDDYKPRGVRVWRDYDSFWAVFDDQGKAYPLKEIYYLATDIQPRDFKTDEAEREIQRYFVCRTL